MKRSRFAKRMASECLVAALVFTMLPAAASGAAAGPAARNIGHGLEKSPDGALNVTEGRVRGVIDNIEELPQYAAGDSQEDPDAGKPVRGTPDRPFVVLEIVPYEEFAEFGYLIGGCEPVKIEEMYGRGDMSAINSLNDARIEPHNAYYFPEEPEGRQENNDGAVLTQSEVRSFTGYYEYVGAGNGTFVQTSGGDGAGEPESVPESGGPRYVREDGGDVIWHTVNDFEMEDYPDQSFDEEPRLMTEIGDRVYTTRTSDPAADPVNLVYNHYTYRNHEYFLRQSMKLSKEEADDYSIVVKTITPDALNLQPDWVEYSDLIVLSPRSHVAGMPDIWKKYNRLGKTSDMDGYLSNAIEENDLSWQVALSIYEKCTAKKDFAAIIIDDAFFNPGTVLTDKSRRSVTIDVMDWNLEPSGMTQPAAGYNNNFYKLCVMLMCMDDEVFKGLYLSGDPMVREDGEGRGSDVLQKDDAAIFWAFETFLLVPPGPYKSTDYPYQYWKDPSLWENWKGALGEDVSTKKHWTRDHVFTYPGDTSVSQSFGTNALMTDMDKFEDFAKWLAEEGIEDKPHSSDAVHFILGAGEEDDDGSKRSLRVLDLEPSVGLKEDGSPDWYLNESYVHMLLPSFTGDIEIVHQTTAEFIGKTEDLNSTYQMIFLGMDYGAYNTRQQNVSGIQAELPDWNDDALDGMIYLHTGDKMVAASYVNKGDTRSVEWLYSPESGQRVKGSELRFAGNDITLLKKKDLEHYRDGGYPIVADRYLYDLEKGLVDERSYIYSFIKETKQKMNADPDGGARFKTNLFSIMETEKIAGAVDAVSASPVTFTQLPPNYSGETIDSASEVFKDQHYLPINSGRSYMEFGFDLAEDGCSYRYRIYVDQDRDSKFSDEEVIIDNPASVGHNYYNYRIAWSSYMVGMVQWKIEVYMDGNEQHRYVEQGSSAARNTTGIRKKINVLQIMPSDGEYLGKLDLEESELFRKYYEDLADYEIRIKSITMDEYEEFFKGKGFSYDNSRPAAEDNPKNYEMLDEELTGYNMLILGFGDSYGGRNLDNTDGAVDYVKFFIDQGHSVLFCHDLTSFYNLSLDADQKLDKNSSFGSTANALLRDVMGMNRYKAVSIRPDEEERERIIRYEEMQGDDSYDWLSGDARHGYTYWAMKRLGFSGGDQDGTQRMPFANMITNPHGDSVMNDSRNGKETGMNNASDLTTIASKLNDGQITEYPYDIEEPLRIAKTHGQYYQLDAEDEDVTVWYTLGPDESIGDTGNPSDGTSLTYEASPNDAMNNYYIYSKGNIFYSGVGHETVEQPMEAKLFVNTMIAAYNASYEPPVVEVDNEDAFLTGGQEYRIEIMQEYDSISDGDQLYSLGEGQDYGDETYPVVFSPTDFNVVTTQLTCSIRYLDENGDPLGYVTSVVLMENGARGDTLEAEELEPSGDQPEGGMAFLQLENGKQYVLDYPKKYLNGWTEDGIEHAPVRAIEFRIKNNRVKSYNTTVLYMSMQPLFPLD